MLFPDCAGFDPPRRTLLLIIFAASGIHRALADRPTRAAVAAIPAQYRAPLRGRVVPRAQTWLCGAFGCLATAAMESKMPKLKTKSGANKRFYFTATGKVKFQQSGKRHGMIKRTTKQIREHRGTAVLFKTDGDNIKKYWLPYG